MLLTYAYTLADYILQTSANGTQNMTALRGQAGTFVNPPGSGFAIRG